MSTVIPQLVFATGGISPACDAILQTRQDADFGPDCLQNLDAPCVMPAGSTRAVMYRPDGWKPAQRVAAPSVFYRR